MATNVMVCCRFRPPSKGEQAEGAKSIASVDSSGSSVSILDGSGVVSQNTNLFNFDHVFDWITSQHKVFEHTAQPLVKEVFAGYNTTVFAYGQTGSGKTHTMMGVPKSESDQGIIPRLVAAIFNGIEEAEIGIEFTVKLSYVEIYNERVRDLLTPNSADNLKIRDLSGGQGVYIEGVTETYVNSYEQVISMMNMGQEHRAMAATNMNEHSSRSHSVFILTLGQLDQNTGSKKGAKLTLVDLAGSEKVGKTGAVGQTLDEAKHINKSLSALGNVINALTSAGAHIPYRDSKLTRLLSDSLGGNSKTCLIITCSPMSTNMEETLSTLRFGTRAKFIKNKPKINQEKSVAEYKELLNKANHKINNQTHIIEVLESDLQNLLECLTAAELQHAIKIDRPKLLSRESNFERVKLARVEGIEQALENDVNDNAGKSSSSATSLAAPATNSVQPPTVTTTLPSLSSVLNSSSASSPEPEPEASAATPASSARSTSLSAHSSLTLSDLLSTNEDLRAKIDEYEKKYEEQSELFQDKLKEIEDAQEMFQSEKNKLEDEKRALEMRLDDELKRVRDAQDQAALAHDMLSEFNMLKQKMIYLEKEHALQLSEKEGDLKDLQGQLEAVQGKLHAAELKLAAQLDLYNEAIGAKNQPTNVDSTTSSAPSTPTATDEKKKFKMRMSAPPLNNEEAYSVSSSSFLHPLMKSPLPALAETSSDLDLMDANEQRTHIETLTGALQRKCDKYLQLQMAHQNQNEHMHILEEALSDANARLKQEKDASQQKIKELQTLLEQSEKTAQKLLESGKYWRSERNKQLSQQANPGKIVMPLLGGGKKPTNALTSSLKSGTSYQGIGSNTPKSAVTSTGNTSIGSHIVGAPKRDGMSMFF